MTEILSHALSFKIQIYTYIPEFKLCFKINFILIKLQLKNVNIKLTFIYLNKLCQEIN